MRRGKPVAADLPPKQKPLPSRKGVTLGKYREIWPSVNWQSDLGKAAE